MNAITTKDSIVAVTAYDEGDTRLYDLNVIVLTYNGNDLPFTKDGRYVSQAALTSALGIPSSTAHRAAADGPKKSVRGLKGHRVFRDVKLLAGSLKDTKYGRQADTLVALSEHALVGNGRGATAFFSATGDQPDSEDVTVEITEEQQIANSIELFRSMLQPNEQHIAVIKNVDLAHALQTTGQNLRKHKERHPDKLKEGEHYFYEERGIERGTNSTAGMENSDLWWTLKAMGPLVNIVNTNVAKELCIKANDQMFEMVREKKEQSLSRTDSTVLESVSKSLEILTNLASGNQSKLEEMQQQIDELKKKPVELTNNSVELVEQAIAAQGSFNTKKRNLKKKSDRIEYRILTNPQGKSMSEIINDCRPGYKWDNKKDPMLLRGVWEGTTTEGRRYMSANHVHELAWLLGYFDLYYIERDYVYGPRKGLRLKTGKDEYPDCPFDQNAWVSISEGRDKDTRVQEFTYGNYRYSEYAQEAIKLFCEKMTMQRFFEPHQVISLSDGSPYGLSMFEAFANVLRKTEFKKIKSSNEEMAERMMRCQNDIMRDISRSRGDDSIYHRVQAALQAKTISHRVALLNDSDWCAQNNNAET